MAAASTLFNAQQHEQIVSAIRLAEQGTAGEIRVHVEDATPKDPLLRAREVFLSLGMQHTKERNGVLIYIAAKDHKLAVVGDDGIHQKVGPDFWEAEKDLLIHHFAKGEYSEGLVKVITLVGEQLKKYFPRQPGDSNELPDEVSFK